MRNCCSHSSVRDGVWQWQRKWETLTHSCQLPKIINSSTPCVYSLYPGAFHHNKWNQLIHIIFVPLIVWSAMIFLIHLTPGQQNAFILLNDKDMLASVIPTNGINLSLFAFLGYAVYYLTLDFVPGVRRNIHHIDPAIIQSFNHSHHLINALTIFLVVSSSISAAYLWHFSLSPLSSRESSFVESSWVSPDWSHRPYYFLVHANSSGSFNPWEASTGLNDKFLSITRIGANFHFLWIIIYIRISKEIIRTSQSTSQGQY